MARGNKPIYGKPGDRHGHLIIVKEVERHRQSSGVIRRRFLCRCDCGRQSVVQLPNLRTGHTTSCGCVQKAAGRGNAKHRLTGTRIYRIWTGMIQRCCNPRVKRYDCYGGRGITVCQRWRDSFEAFLEDMGEPPTEKHSIDRVDNDGNYEKSNCRWATNKVQSRNSRHNVMLTINRETMCVSAWADRMQIKPKMIYDRLATGWQAPDAVMVPKGKRRTS